MLLTTLIPALLATAAAAAASQNQLYHRFQTHPSPNPPTPFVPLARLEPSEFAVVSVQFSSDGDVALDARDDGKGWYQVALSRDVSEDEGDWLIASTRACYLAAGPPLIRISTESDPASRPIHLSLHPSPALRSSGCPASANGTSLGLPKSSQEVTVEFVQPTIVVKGPQLAAAPNLDPTTGTVVPPPEEKSWTQKYWMYILGIGIFFAITMGPDEPKGGAKGN
ncbi:hypothetical protein IAU60_004343 [Kwoniella sp. DSM 27419]